MARFNFGKRPPEDEGIPPEPIEGETEAGGQPDLVVGDNRMRRPLIFALIGVLLIGGAYLANVLFFSAPEPPPIPTRPVVPAPPGAAPAAPIAPAPAPQKKEAAPTAPAAVAKQQPEAKAEAKSPSPTPPQASKAEPAKVAPPAKSAAEPTAPAKTPAAPAPATKPTPGPAAKGTPAPSAKTEKPAPTKPASSAKGFSVQLGAMAQEANAQNLKRKLDEMGFQAVVRKGSGYANSHVVTVGEPVAKRDAEDTARRLNVEGFPSQLVGAEGKFVPQVGAFVNLDEAIDLARELQKKNFRPKITSKPATTVLYQVRHGQFDTKAAAMKRGEELKAKGLNAWVVPN
jgi:cell division septation protein DedD